MINFSFLNSEKIFFLFFTFCLITLIALSSLLIIKDHQNKKIIESYDNLNETECRIAQLRCYRHNMNLSENETVSKCREIDFCEKPFKP